MKREGGATGRRRVRVTMTRIYYVNLFSVEGKIVWCSYIVKLLRML